MSLLNRSSVDTSRDSARTPPVRDMASSAVQQVHRIVDHAQAGTDQKNWTYLVRWQGFGADNDEWLPLEKFKDCKELVDEYHREKNLKPIEWKMGLEEMRRRYGRVKKITLKVGKEGGTEGEKEGGTEGEKEGGPRDRGAG
ncbi:hypothetical protein EV426DRAFT_574025 [Tirmania nivea]|nr:hypothetical protein EV426DRAFT_574025 [Tirmania nivea]